MRMYNYSLIRIRVRLSICVLWFFLAYMFVPFFLNISHAETTEGPRVSGRSGNFLKSSDEKSASDIEAAESRPRSDEFDEFDEFDEEFEGDDGVKRKEVEVYDPIEPFNRAMFYFNDKVYFWILTPLVKGYSFVVPEAGRVGVRRFFSNIATPIRFVNSLLQLQFKAAGVELGRFVINTTIGIAGFMDPARKMNLYKKEEDLGQTLGHYGVGYGFYVNLPFLGPSTLRDTVGKIGDLFLDPVIVLTPFNTVEKMGISAYRVVNEVSLTPTLYSEIVKKSFDPYTFMKSAYYQIRESRIKQ